METRHHTPSSPAGKTQLHPARGQEAPLRRERKHTHDPLSLPLFAAAQRYLQETTPAGMPWQPVCSSVGTEHAGFLKIRPRGGFPRKANLFKGLFGDYFEPALPIPASLPAPGGCSVMWCCGMLSPIKLNSRTEACWLAVHIIHTSMQCSSKPVWVRSTE